MPAATLSLSFLLIFFLSSTPTTTSQSQPAPCHRHEAAALLDIKRSFGGPPSLSSWNESETPDCCVWDGVRCDYATGAVTDLFLQTSPDLSGPISPSVALLLSLRQLIVSAAHVTGTIPPSIGSLANLTLIIIDSNPALTGTIPAALCDLPNLAALYLYNNSLSGSIPPCFANKKNLIILDLSRNRLSGPIPAGLMRGADSVFPHPKLFLNGNRLTGPIPRSLGDVPLQIVDVSDNQLAGDASFLFKENGSLQQARLAGNELEFDMSKVKFPLGLRELNMGRNRVYGRIPPQISEIRRLKRLDLSYNRLCGPIPTGGPMKKFRAKSFAGNKCLCGGPLQPCHSEAKD